MTNFLEKLQFNEVVSISSIIILYELTILFLYLFGVINNNSAKDYVSWALILNFFIIFVMFLTDCKIDTNIKIIVVSVKLILLFFVLLKANFSFKNYLIGTSFLLIYYFFSNINKVYSCNVKFKNLITSFGLSSLLYFIIFVSTKK